MSHNPTNSLDFAADLAKLYVTYEMYDVIDAVDMALLGTFIDRSELMVRCYTKHPEIFNKVLLDSEIKVYEMDCVLQDLECDINKRIRQEKAQILLNYSCAVDEIVKSESVEIESEDDSDDSDLLCAEQFKTIQSMIDNWNDPCSLLVA